MFQYVDQNQGTPPNCLANQNAGFPVTTNTTCNRSNENAGFPDTTKLHAEEEAA